MDAKEFDRLFKLALTDPDKSLVEFLKLEKNGYMREDCHKDLLIAVGRVYDFVKENDIENIVLIDKSARPAHAPIREYFRLKEELPAWEQSFSR